MVIDIMSQSIPWVPNPPPGVCRAFVILAKKNVANAPLWGANNATKSPPLGTDIDVNAPALGDKI
jgi:hypothetical protein